MCIRDRFKGENLLDTYTTANGGKFTTKEYPCGSDYTIHEITPSEGYLLDETIYPVGAEPVSYTHLDVYKRQGFDLKAIPVVMLGGGASVVKGNVSEMCIRDRKKSRPRSRSIASAGEKRPIRS